MSPVSSCVRRSVLVHAVSSAVLGLLLLLLLLLVQLLVNDEEVGGASLLPLYLVGGAMVVVGVLGAVGAQRLNMICLILFLVCVVIGALLTLLLGGLIALGRPYLEQELSNEYRESLPLDHEPDHVTTMTEDLQTEWSCCGMFSHTDWTVVPASCLCSDESGGGDCMTLPEDGAVIYRQPCFQFHLVSVLLGLDVMVGVLIFVLMLALLGLVLVSVLIHQMNRAPCPPPQRVAYSPPTVSWS